MSNLRLELVQKLGGKCVICGETDTRILQVDHKLGHGYLEKEYFESKEKMQEYYLENYEQESKNIQLLCFNCNTKKRISNAETRGRPSLKVYLELFKRENLTNGPELANKIDDLLSEHPQFVPIDDRLAPILGTLVELEKQRRDIKKKIEETSKKIPKPIHDFFIQDIPVPHTATVDVLKNKIIEFIKKEESLGKEVNLQYIAACFIDESNYGKKDIEYAINMLIHEGKIPKTSFSEYEIDNSNDKLPLLRDEIFMKVLKELEGTNKDPVPFRLFVKNLINTRKFFETSAENMIWQMEFDKKIYQPKEGFYNIVTEEILEKIIAKEKEDEEKRNSQISKIQLFFNIIKSLEGENKIAVEGKMFTKELVKSGKFTEEEARNYIRRMLREASIYESKPGHYNSIL